MTKLDALDEKLSESSAPHFCEIICNESEFEREPSEHPVEALLRDFEQKGAASFDDPKFRIIFESTFALRQMVPRSARELLLETDEFLRREGKMTTSETSLFAARFQIEFVRYTWNLKMELPRIEERRDLYQTVRALQKECKHVPSAGLYQRCLEIDPRF